MARKPRPSMEMPSAPKVAKAQTITPNQSPKTAARARGRAKLKSSPQVRANQRKPYG